MSMSAVQLLNKKASKNIDSTEIKKNNANKSQLKSKYHNYIPMITF